MRKTQASGWMMRNASLSRAAWFTAAALGIGLVMAAGPVRAADDDEDDKTFEEKIIEGIMRGLGGTNMENRGIEYRERRSEEHTSELQSRGLISYAVFCLKKKTK